MRTRSLAFSVAFIRVVHVHPGILVADIGHLEEVFVQASLADGLLEERFMGARRAGGHHHPVDIFSSDHLFHFVLGVLGAGEQVVLYVHHVGQRCGHIRARPAHRRHRRC
jgi:hypothetical protein